MKLMIFDKSEAYSMEIIDGVEYCHYIAPWKRPLYKITTVIQYCLWKVGIPWHNWFADECTPDFNCCANKFNDEEKEILNAIANSTLGIIPIGEKIDETG